MKKFSTPTTRRALRWAACFLGRLLSYLRADLEFDLRMIDPHNYRGRVCKVFWGTNEN